MRKDPKKINKFITEILAMEAEDAQEAGRLAFMARAMVMATLPHSEQKGHIFQRRNGNYSLTITAHPQYGLPYGSIPRLLLAWMTTEAVRKKSATLELGKTVSNFLKKLNLSRQGGARGDITRLKQQMLRLFTSSITCIYSDKEQSHFTADQFHLVRSFQLWWDPLKNDVVLPNTCITLSKDFFEEITTRPIPIDFAALQMLRRSPLQLDLYIWLTYRLSYLKKDVLLPWDLLKMQFGSNYAENNQGLRDFRKNFLSALHMVSMTYKDAKFNAEEVGLRLFPSTTHVKKSRGGSVNKAVN